jgi:hypothetical protein
VGLESEESFPRMADSLCGEGSQVGVVGGAESESEQSYPRLVDIVFRGKESSAHSITQQLTELTTDGWLSAVAGRIYIRRFLGGIRVREETEVWLILLFGVASGRVGLMLAKDKCTGRR